MRSGEGGDDKLCLLPLCIDQGRLVETGSGSYRQEKPDPDPIIKKTGSGSGSNTFFKFNSGSDLFRKIQPDLTKTPSGSGPATLLLCSFCFPVMLSSDVTRLGYSILSTVTKARRTHLRSYSTTQWVNMSSVLIVLVLVVGLSNAQPQHDNAWKPHR